MKVQFNAEEMHAMVEAVLDEVAKLKFDQPDRASVRRWLTDEMVPGSVALQRIADKLNDELQQTHDRSEVSPIKKPDWL